jgi:hypothetical protein
MVVRQYNEELKYLEKINPYCWRIKKGFQPNMNVSLTSVMSYGRLVNNVFIYVSLTGFKCNSSLNEEIPVTGK